MRVCQPSLPARKTCTTSGERRIVVDTLGGAFCGPRTRRPSVFCQLASHAAALAGVQAGDVLLSINGVAVKNIEQVRTTVAKSQKSVALLILRGDSRIFVPVDLG